MPRLHLFCVLLIAALLSLGQAAAAHAVADEVADRAELVPSSSHITGAALPAHIIPAAQAARDLRGVHAVSSVPGNRDRSRGLHGRRGSSSAASGEPLADYFVARLMRGGIDSSSLGTPPPQS